MTTELDEAVASRLKQLDQRYTGSRRSIVAALAGAEGPISMLEISERVGDIPRSSVYRNLGDLETAGVVARVASADESARFELCEDLTGHHHHLICTRCGRVIDIEPPASFEAQVLHEIEALARDVGFTPQSHRVDVLGLCADCA